MTKRDQFLKGLVDDSYSYAMETYDEEPLIFPEIFMTEDSTNAWEQYTTAVGPNRLSETDEGEEIDRTTATEGYTSYILNKKFAVELPISNEAIDDHQKIDNFLKTWAQELGEAARCTKEEVHANVFNKGGFTAGHAVFNNDKNPWLSTGYGSLCYDSKPFFNASGNNRSSKSNSTYYNGKVNLDLDETNLQILWQLMTQTNAYNEAGRKIHIRPNVILVQEGSDNWFTANRIINSQAPVGAAHSGVANLWRGKLRVIGWPYLDRAQAWGLGVARKGLKSLARMPLSIDYYEEKRIDAQVVRARVRFGCGVTNWRFWTWANFSQS